MRGSQMTWLRRGFGLVLSAPLMLAGCATAPVLPDRFAVGRDVNHYRCSANRNWHDPHVNAQFDTAFALTCEGSSASRAVAMVSAVPTNRAKPEDEAACGAPATANLAGLGEAQVRRCFDAVLAQPAVIVRFDRDGKSYRGASAATAAGPMERALLALVTNKAPAGEDSVKTASFNPETLAPAPMVGREGPAVAFDAALPLREGISLNRQGLYVEASRILNDALSRLPATTPKSVQIELLLEAGLADSNIRFTAAAADHFAGATALLAERDVGDRTAFLERKRSTYNALDALNRRDWATAVASLNGSEAAFPLTDPATLANLNRSASRDTSSAVAGPSAGQLSEIVLDAQRNWAASIAILSRGGAGSLEEGSESLKRAAANVETLLNARVDPSSLLWLTAQIERQAGRIDARRAGNLSESDRAQAYDAAVAKFDCALAALRGLRPADENACTVPLAPPVRMRVVAASAQVAGPIIAETQIERAGLRSLAGASTEIVLADYQQGIEALIASGRGGSSAPTGLEAYLDLLTNVAQQKPASPAAEQFFQAIQAVGEPAIARQMSQLQQVVTANGATAAKLRERAELEREIAGLRYQIADSLYDAAKRDDLDKQRQQKEQQKAVLDEQLLGDSRARSIDDRPITVAQVQSALAPDEVYLKLAEIRTKPYGILIGKTSATIYALNANSATLDNLAAAVRASIRSGSDVLPVFSVASSYALFDLVAGPAKAQLLGAKALIVDPAGPLSILPAGVLVTDLASVKAFTATQKKGPRDYSKVAFLADRADISTALSPRSFLEARALPQSKAANPFIGLGQHGAPIDPGSPTLMEQIGLGCPISRADLIGFSTSNEPISANKITIAANAFGTPNAPRMVGADFSDTAVKARTDLDTFEVLHFATHGIPETKVGCASVPPSLITTIAGPESDGFLSFSEVAGLRLDANLVVLSACETSVSADAETARRAGQEETGRSLDGLVRAFLTANARAVLATYWPVSVEQESDVLFTTFYSHGRTESIGDSLRAAQQALIHQPRYSHPYYWGAYFVVGDASKTLLTKSAVPTTAGAK